MPFPVFHYPVMVKVFEQQPHARGLSAQEKLPILYIFSKVLFVLSFFQLGF
jgi:hypothetical protein